MDEDCVFCRLAADPELPGLVYADAWTLAFIDLRQFHPGHTLVVPRQHFRDMRDMDAATGTALMATLAMVTRAVSAAFPSEGISLWHSIGPAAHQEVPHLHIHVHPRKTDDRVLRVYPSSPATPDTRVLRQYAQMVKANLPAAAARAGEIGGRGQHGLWAVPQPGAEAWQKDGSTGTRAEIQPVQILDLDTYGPTDAEIVTWYELMTAADQLQWEYDDVWAKAPTTPQQEIASFRRRQVEQQGQNHSFWAIADGKVVGHAGINRYPGAARQHCAELGFAVAAAFTRRGIGTSLVEAAARKARQLGLRRLEADCFADNQASIALLRKCGFQEEGLRVGAICRNGALRNQRLFGRMV